MKWAQTTPYLNFKIKIPLMARVVFHGSNDDINKANQKRLDAIVYIFQHLLNFPTDVANVVCQSLVDEGGAFEHILLMEQVLRKRMASICRLHLPKNQEIVTLFEGDFHPELQVVIKKLRKQLHQVVDHRRACLVAFRSYHRHWKQVIPEKS